MFASNEQDLQQGRRSQGGGHGGTGPPVCKKYKQDCVYFFDARYSAFRN